MGGPEVACRATEGEGEEERVGGEAARGPKGLGDGRGGVWRYLMPRCLFWSRKVCTLRPQRNASSLYTWR